VMQTAESGATRERMWRAKTNEGGKDNLGVLGEIVRLRHEYAALFGSPSYADFVLRRRMAESMANTQRFLEEVRATLTEREKQDLAELRDMKARHLGEPLERTTLQRWDVSFYSERLKRERYSADQEAFRRYFSPEPSLQFTLRVIEKMMGVRYSRVPARLWHPGVQAYAVSDAASGKALATLYVDLYPRPGKYNHAAVFGLRAGSTRSARASQAALVVNFNRDGLTLDELETLLHELGHSVHNNLSNTRYASQAGTSVQRDFVEAPSQMLEDWVYDRRVLDVFKEVCPACTPVPEDMLKKAAAARDADKGVQYARQHLYASYDLALHGPEVAEPMALWERMEGATPLGHVSGTMFPAGFAHVAGGYAAGYYGYLWSLVVAMDLRTAFEADKLDPAVGMRYRNTVLGHGSEVPPKTLVREFLGRETNSKAFFDFLRKQ
jgi:thimet oligopeptidase